ncbi:transglycosylase domain-containing protein [Acidocella sp.]|jgi:penicillin-binding protein 1A|uniref:transglycosylase domain-containing protein n=1 Tax=Acidocella sp. TaxID=50710 RepID=UPI002F401411
MARRKSIPVKTPPWLRTLGLVLRYAVIGGIWSAVAIALALLYFTWDMPSPAHALTSPRRPAIRLFDLSGHLAARFGDVAGRVVLPGDLPPYVPGAFIAIEDRRFYDHGAFDLQGIARASLSDLVHRRVVQGGSTLTQQVAKTLFLTDQRSLRRKIQEALLSLWLTRHYTKQEILGIYLNRVYLGEGAYGVDAAAQLYFGVPAAQLTLAQAAILAGLPQAPSSLNPLADPRAAADRAREVLNAMVATQRITLDQENNAEQQLGQAAVPRSQGSWFALWVMQHDGGAIPEGQDVSLTTTLDPRLQSVAEAALTSAIAAHGTTLRIQQGAVVVLDAKTGAVRALVGGVGDRDGYDRAVLARRQTGSAIKPIVWLAGLRAGMSPDDKVLDAPLYFRGYDPRDDERVYHGDVTMTEALSDSMNTVAIRILLRAGGPRRVIALARLLGLDDHFPDDVTMALGTGGVGVMQLAGAYATFFNGGNRVTPYGVTAINGAPYAVPPPVPVIAPDQAGDIAAMMRAVVLNGTGTGAFVPGLYTAGKTGTTQDYRDAWFVGDAGPDIIAVWVGNDNDTPMKSVYGGTVPAAVFKAIAVSLAGQG